MVEVIEVEVSQKAYALVKGFSSFIKKVKEEVQDNEGFSAVDDLPGILGAAVTDLVPAFDGITTIGEDFKSNKKAFIRGVLIGLDELVQIFVEEEKEEEK